MKIKIVVLDFDVPRRIRKWTLRIGAGVVTFGILLALLAGTRHGAYASQIGWEAGQLLTAESLDHNFNELYEAGVGRSQLYIQNTCVDNPDAGFGTMDCVCDAGGYAISGGGFGGPPGMSSAAIAESQNSGTLPGALGTDFWRLTCVDHSGNRTRCNNGFALCLKVR